MSAKNKYSLTEKDIQRFRKGKPGDHLQLPLLFSSALLLMVTLTLGILSFSEEGTDSFLISFYVFLGASLISLIMFALPKFFPKKKIDELNTSLYEGTLNVTPKVSFPISKSLLIQKKIENQSIEQLQQDSIFMFPDKKISVYVIERCVEMGLKGDKDYSNEIVKPGDDLPSLGDKNLRRSFQIPFKGTLIILSKNDWNFEKEIEFRQVKDSISPSINHSEQDLIKDVKDLKDFDVYSKDKEYALKEIDKYDIQEKLSLLAKKYQKGIVLILNGKEIIVELYGLKLDLQPIQYKDTYPWDTYERKKRDLDSLKEIAEAFMR